MKGHITTTGLGRLAQRIIERATFKGIESQMRTMADEMIAAYNRNVETFTPGPVRDLRSEYKKTKMRRYGRIYPILRASGAMMGSLYRRVYRDDNEYRIFIGTRGGMSGIQFKKAMAHIEGAGNLPKRDFTKLPRSFWSKWTKRLTTTLRKGK